MRRFLALVPGAAWLLSVLLANVYLHATRTLLLRAQDRLGISVVPHITTVMVSSSLWLQIGLCVGCFISFAFLRQKLTTHSGAVMFGLMTMVLLLLLMIHGLAWMLPFVGMSPGLS